MNFTFGQSFDFNLPLSFKKRGYKTVCMSLYVNDVFFDNDKLSRFGKRVERELSPIYWKIFCKFKPKKYFLAIRLSALHFRINDLERYLDKMLPELGALAYPHRLYDFYKWPSNTEDGAYCKEASAILFCDYRLFKKLYDKFWFELSCELQMEVFLIGYDITKKHTLKWTRRLNWRKVLLENADYVFDNFTNGFHIGITSRGGDNYRKILQNIKDLKIREDEK